MGGQKDLAQISFFSGNNLLDGRISGFTDAERGVITYYAKEFINSGQYPIVISFGNGKQICDPILAFRASEIAENYGLTGLYIVHHLLWGFNPITHQEALAAFYALKDFHKQFMEKMKK